MIRATAVIFSIAKSYILHEINQLFFMSKISYLSASRNNSAQYNWGEQYMLKRISLYVLALGMSLSAAHAGETGDGSYKKLYKVTIQNLTTGQPITPVIIAVHAPSYKLVKLGEKATDGLAVLATDGITSELVSELESEQKVVRTAIGTGIILPGNSESIIVEANNPHFKLSLVSMLARTNDAISVLSSASLPIKKGRKIYYLSSVYDAGVEMNTESCSDIPAPPCGSHNIGQSEDSFIRPHAGVQLIGDLEAKRDTFASKVSKVTIERIQ